MSGMTTDAPPTSIVITISPALVGVYPSRMFDLPSAVEFTGYLICVIGSGARGVCKNTGRMKRPDITSPIDGRFGGV